MKIKFVAGLAAITSPDRHAGRPALLTFYTFTSPFAGTIRTTPPPTQPTAKLRRSRH
jgi:hypothetical protein